MKKYEATLEKSKFTVDECCVTIKTDNWELYKRLVKLVEKELKND